MTTSAPTEKVSARCDCHCHNSTPVCMSCALQQVRWTRLLLRNFHYDSHNRDHLRPCTPRQSAVNMHIIRRIIMVRVWWCFFVYSTLPFPSFELPATKARFCTFRRLRGHVYIFVFHAFIWRCWATAGALQCWRFGQYFYKVIYH